MKTSELTRAPLDSIEFGSAENEAHFLGVLREARISTLVNFEYMWGANLHKLDAMQRWAVSKGIKGCFHFGDATARMPKMLMFKPEADVASKLGKEVVDNP